MKGKMTGDTMIWIIDLHKSKITHAMRMAKQNKPKIFVPE